MNDFAAYTTGLLVKNAIAKRILLRIYSFL